MFRYDPKRTSTYAAPRAAGKAGGWLPVSVGPLWCAREACGFQAPTISLHRSANLCRMPFRSQALKCGLARK